MRIGFADHPSVNFDGGTAMYQAMHSLGFAAESSFKGPTKLAAAPKGASVLVLGAGIAGMVAAFELRNAGYKVQVLEYNGRVGGRNWTLRGGDRYTELGGFTQECGFDPGLYINPGSWRLPYHHHGAPRASRSGHFDRRAPFASRATPIGRPVPRRSGHRARRGMDRRRSIRHDDILRCRILQKQ